MPITLTCQCGKKQLVAPEMAGQKVACVMCGNALKVPALGVLASKPKAKPVARVLPVGLILAAAGVLLTLLGAVGFLAWAVSNQPTAPKLIVQNDGGPGDKPHEPPAEERKVEEKKPAEVKPKDSPNQVIQPIKPSDPPKHVIEKVKSSDPPKQVIEPVKPSDPPKKISEPVKPKDPPKTVVEPVKPKPPPVVEKKLPPLNVIESVKLVWKLREGEVFYQELGVTQKPTFKVAGLPIAMFVQYHVVSRFTVKKQNKDGSLVVEQKIESARLVQADELSKGSIALSLGQLAGTTYTLELSPKMDVTKFDGAKDNPQIKNLQIAGGVGMQMSSLIDRDGWKELAQATFFQLDLTPKANMAWSKPMTHNWGSMGSWHGQIHYLYMGQQKDLHRITYGLKLAYKAPVVGAGAGMMKLNGANFQPQQAGGELIFDSARGRVVLAQETFRVKGLLNANVLGQNTLVEIDEEQHFAIRIHDKLP